MVRSQYASTRIRQSERSVHFSDVQVLGFRWFVDVFPTFGGCGGCDVFVVVMRLQSFARLLRWAYNARTCYSVVDRCAGNVISSAFPVLHCAALVGTELPVYRRLTGLAERLRRGFNGYSLLPRYSRGFII
jgi:hypothetical protein